MELPEFLYDTLSGKIRTSVEKNEDITVLWNEYNDKRIRNIIILIRKLELAMQNKTQEQDGLLRELVKQIKV